MGISDPQVLMLLVRLAHAAYSLLAVVYGFRLAEEMGAGTVPASWASCWPRSGSLPSRRSGTSPRWFANPPSSPACGWPFEIGTEAG